MSHFIVDRLYLLIEIKRTNQKFQKINNLKNIEMANMRNTRFLEYSVRILTLKLGDNPIRYGTLCSYDPILTSGLGGGRVKNVVFFNFVRKNRSFIKT